MKDGRTCRAKDMRAECRAQGIDEAAGLALRRAVLVSFRWSGRPQRSEALEFYYACRLLRISQAITRLIAIAQRIVVP